MVLVLAMVAVGGFVVAPKVLFVAAGASAPRRSIALPWLAVALFVVAWFLPNPDLPTTDSFVRHAVGGGVASALLGAFLVDNLAVRSPTLRMAASYVVAAAFGVATELAELAAGEVLGRDLTDDSAWDLLANTAGAVTTALVLEVLRWRRGRSARLVRPA